MGSGLDTATRAAGRCGSATENKAPAWQLRITFHRRPRLRLRSWPLHRSFARKGDVRFFVFASLGTLLGQRYGLFRRIARAAKALDAQLLIAHCGGLAPPEAQALIKAGATWVTDFAPQQAVLERADAVVTHAGLNTVMDALSTRTPMLASGRELQAKLEQLLTDARFRPPLGRLSLEVNNAGGSRAAAEIVERATSCSR